jgi:hypothetical protein
MRHTLILPGALIVVGLAGHGAVAQQQAYETPRYTTETQSTLDKNYGMPSMPSADQLPQRTMAPEKPMPEKPDFFAKRPETDWPKPRTDSASAMTMETPLYTTGEPTPNADMTTGGFTTGGFTTGDVASSSGGFGSKPLTGSNRVIGR